MSKLAKQYWFNSKGKKNVSCYKAMITKEVLKQANIDADEEVKIYANDNKIIIEKKEQAICQK